MIRWNRFAAGLAILMGGMQVAHSQGLTTMNPSYTYANVLPSGFAPAGIGGLDFLGTDGVICTWGGSDKTAGEVYILPGLATGTTGIPVKIDGPLREPLGLRVVNGEIFVITKPEFFKYTKQTDGSWKRSSVAKGWAFSGNWHHFAFGLVYSQGFFYFATGTAFPPDLNENPERGSIIKVDPATGAFKALVKGLRNANGLGVGPDGELFTTDNQGDWVPTNKLVHIKEGRYYGYKTNKNSTEGTPIAPPAISMSYGDYSNSPTRILLLKDGPYKGQMLAGDVFYGGLQRYFLEKVGGEYQGAAFRFAGGGSNSINYGVNELVPGPDGNIYVAGIGGGCCQMGGSTNWNYSGRNYGLGRLTPTTTVPFEILAMRSVAGGFELEFTAPVSAAAATATNYSVQSWTDVPSPGYGTGHKQNRENTTQITKVEVSSDKKKVTLSIGNLRTGRTYYVKVGSGVTMEGGGALRTGEAWYTLNKLGPATDQVSKVVEDFSRSIKVGIRPGATAIELPFVQSYRVDLLGLDGRRIASAQGNAPGRLDVRGVRSGLYVVAGKVGSERFSQRVRIP
ncbi:MAG TPA: hypothetical protein VK465_07210 [Fibrobacteria bacterium]|nr:hypothetical protein [Fibrobacteria bacterium]